MGAGPWGSPRCELDWFQPHIKGWPNDWMPTWEKEERVREEPVTPCTCPAFHTTKKTSSPSWPSQPPSQHYTPTQPRGWEILPATLHRHKRGSEGRKNRKAGCHCGWYIKDPHWNSSLWSKIHPLQSLTAITTNKKWTANTKGWDMLGLTLPVVATGN